MNRYRPEAGIVRGPSPINPHQQAAEQAAEKTAQCATEQWAQRQKYWSELKEHERIERLREVNKRLESRLEIAEAFIRSLIDHKHGHDGSICGPFDPHRNMPKSIYGLAQGQDSCNIDDVYF